MYSTYQYVYTATQGLPPLISNDQLGESNSLVVPLCSAQLQMHKLRSRNLPRFRTHPCLCLPLMNLMHSVSAMYVHCTHSLWQHIFFIIYYIWLQCETQMQGTTLYISGFTASGLGQVLDKQCSFSSDSTSATEVGAVRLCQKI